MFKILLAINPEFANKIIQGDKKYEFRTRVAKKNIDCIVIYMTSPVKKVVAEVYVRSVIHHKPEELWEITKEHAGISKEYFEEYFLDRQIAYAYELGEVTVFEEPRTLGEYGCNHAPQSFMYLN